MTLLVHPKKLDDLFQREHKDQAAHLQLQQTAHWEEMCDLRSISFLKTHDLGSYIERLPFIAGYQQSFGWGSSHSFRATRMPNAKGGHMHGNYLSFSIDI